MPRACQNCASVTGEGSRMPSSPTPATPSAVGEAITRESLIHALRDYRDLRRLAQSSLTELGIVQDALQALNRSQPEHTTRGWALRAVLSAALDSLKPESSEPNPKDVRWYSFIILHEQYINHQLVDVARQQLDPKGRGVSLRTYHRYRISALDRVVDELRTRELERASRRVPPVEGTLHSHPSARPNIIGRNAEVTTLQSWLGQSATTVIGILGLGGVGKTALAKEMAARSATEFDHVIWLSLHNGPPLADLLAEALQSLLGAEVDVEVLESTRRLDNFLRQLRQSRSLVVWDNFETLLETGQPGGRYRAGYEDYGSALREIALTAEPSKLIVTSREAPPEWSGLASRSGAIQTLQLDGLDPQTGHALLANTTLHGDDEAWSRFVQAYSGNPLVLKITADVVSELFGGDLAHYLNAGVPLLADAHAVLQQQFDRLDPHAQDLLFWLAVERDPVTAAQLGSRLVPGLDDRTLYEVLYDLRRRSLIERDDSAFTLQQVVLEYLTERLIADMARELMDGRAQRLQTHSLLTVDARDYVLQSQRRQLLQPLAERLQRLAGNRERAIARCQRLLDGTRDVSERRPGYLAGSLVNLLQALGHELGGLDLSGRSLWHAHFGATPLINVNLAGADLAHTVFVDVFDGLASTAWSPDGEMFVAGTITGDIRVWRAADGRPLRTLTGHTDWVRSLRYSRDGHRLASACADHTLRVWDVGSGECLHALAGHARRVRTVAFNSDGRMLASGSDDYTMRIWDTSTGDCVRVLTGHTDRVYAVTFSPDGRWLVSGSWDKTIRVWDATDWRCLTVISGHTGWVRSLDFNPAGTRLVSAGQDNTLRLWDVATWRCLRVLTGHTQAAHQAVFSPDGQRIASGGEDKTIRLWDADSGACLNTLAGHTEYVESLAFSPSGQRLVSASVDSSLRLWDAEAGRCLKVLAGHAHRLWVLALSPDDRWIAAGSNDRQVRVWELATGQAIHTWQAHTGWVDNVAFDHGGRWLATCSDDSTVCLWECGTWRRRYTFTGHTRWCGALAFHPLHPLLASGGEDETIRLWNLETGECAWVLEGRYQVTRVLNFSPDGRWMVSAGDLGAIFVWDTETWQIIRRLEAHHDVLWALAFDRQGRRLASAGEDRTILIWDTTTWQVIRRLTGHRDRIYTLDFHPEGHLLASGSTDRTARLWDTATGACHHIWIGAGVMRHIVFDSTGGQLITADDDETLEVWDTETYRCLRTIHSQRLYEGLDLTGAVGLSPAQRASLLSLGAVDRLASEGKAGDPE